MLYAILHKSKVMDSYTSFSDQDSVDDNVEDVVTYDGSMSDGSMSECCTGMFSAVGNTLGLVYLTIGTWGVFNGEVVVAITSLAFGIVCLFISICVYFN